MVNKSYSFDMVSNPVVEQPTVLNPVNSQGTFGNNPFSPSSQVSTWSEWRRGYVSSTFNFESTIIIPDYWLRIVKVIATVSPMHAKVPDISLSGMSANTGHPENPPGTPKLVTGDESAHRHKWFVFLANGVAFANSNGTAYGPGAITWGASIGQSANNDGWTLAGDAHHHDDDHTHSVGFTTAASSVTDYVDSTDAAIVDLYMDGVLVKATINTVTSVDLSAVLNGAQLPRLPAVGSHLLTFTSTKFGEVEVVLNWYVVSKPPEGF